ncbi:MAG: hypothetical protein WCI30_00955 [Clostridia bacterium]
MKKLVRMILILMLTLSLLVGCSSGEAAPQSAEEAPVESPAEALDIAGKYTGTMTLGKTQIVYNSDGNLSSEPYAAEGKSEWEGESVEVSFEVQKIDDSTLKITTLGEDTSSAMVYQGAYDIKSNQFTSKFQQEDAPSLENTLSLKFSEIEGIIRVEGTLNTVSSAPELVGLVNEIAIAMQKVE